MHAYFSAQLDGFPPADVANGTLAAIVSKVANLCEVAPPLIPQIIAKIGSYVIAPLLHVLW